MSRRSALSSNAMQEHATLPRPFRLHGGGKSAKRRFDANLLSHSATQATQLVFTLTRVGAGRQGQG
eukprot:917732-Prymnesium_polylepis.1